MTKETLSPEQMYYAHLDHFLVDEVDKQLGTTVGELALGAEHKARMQLYRKSRGQLQLALAGEHLSEEGYESIRALSRFLPGGKTDSESEEEEDLLMHEMKGARQRQVRWAVLYGVIFTFIILVMRSFFPATTIDFKPVEALVYETRMMEDDFATRVDLESADLDDIREYFVNYPDFIWEDVFMQPTPEWRMKGASVLDYEMVKISLVAFSKRLSGHDVLEEEREIVSADGTETRVEVVQTNIPRQDMFVHYSFAAKANYLPDIEPSLHKGLEYYAYASETYNVIMWKTQSQYHLLIGRLAPTEMVKFIP